MKKITYVIFTLLLIIPLMVNAKIRDIELEHQFNTGVSHTYKEVYTGKTGDNYILFGDVEFKTFDNQGKELINFSLEDLYTTYVYSYSEISYGDYIYISYSNSSSYYLSKVSTETGEVVKTIDIPCGFFEAYIAEDGIVFINNDNNVYLIDEELNGYTKITELPPSIEEHPNSVDEDTALDFYEYLENNYGIDSSEYVVDYVLESDNQYYSAIVREGNVYSIVYTDKDFSEASFMPVINDAFQSPTPGTGASGNQVTDLFVDKNQIIVFVNSELRACLAANLEYYGCGYNAIMQIYQENYFIDSKTDGNGTISATKTMADSGEEITFTVEPKEGYVLGEVKVTDATGNVVTFTDYTFTMPSSDVTIEANFKKVEESKEEQTENNPETSDYLSMYITAAILILEISMIVFFNKKANE